MRVNVFPKKITAKNGNKFTKYVTTLTKKDGSTVYAEVKFSDESLNQVDKFPVTLTINQGDGNFTSKTIHGKDKDGNPKDYIRNTLWVSHISAVEEYIDTSLDDFA